MSALETLLQAEREAESIITEAQNHRVELMKLAKTEAEAELSAIQQQLDQEYSACKMQTIETIQKEAAELKRSTDERIQKLSQLEPLLDEAANLVYNVTIGDD